MTFESLLVETHEAVVRVTLNRPKVLNALNRHLLAELDAVIDAIAADSAIRAVILTGAGEKAFAAGADIAELARLGAAEGQQLALEGQRILARLETLGVPVIAAVNGFALGGGCELAMACTLRIAAETARFGQPEVKLGLIPGYGGTQRLPRLIGHGAALRLVLTGEIISATEALRIGLVDEVVPAADLLARVETVAATIAANAPFAVRQAIASLYGGADLPLDRALAHEAALFGLCCATEDKHEGTDAFLAKRAPQWKGR
ncbi:enoyl-CoA hydratase-related protein [Silvibacterium dinghuense]|uniref:Enoyl-CoA hydratase n=1 Tax=Silvibacterium dinghuense TaxID=1560006 RepID=A0A4V1NW44_9BACT|nr:enoyl-CoA hydratase-related protein [Silvibacterium dinghuense]RXS98132.1 enoyl-CoA hydratase [Silvibacterium dinghuense]